MQIACRKYVYLFDILTLGAGCFEEGLQELLESGDILKVRARGVGKGNLGVEEGPLGVVEGNLGLEEGTMGVV